LQNEKSAHALPAAFPGVEEERGWKAKEIWVLYYYVEK